MDDIVAKPRYVRHSTMGRKKRRNLKEADSLAEKILKQAVISLLILVVIGMIKSVNTPVTGYLTDKIKQMLFHDINFTNIYDKVSELLKGMPDDSKIDEDAFNEDSDPASANLNFADSIGEEGTDYTHNNPIVASEDEISDIVNMIGKKFSFLEPVDGLLVSSFGERFNPRTQLMEFHAGIDIESEGYSSIKSVLDGEVIYAGESPAYGKYIKIDHGDGLVTLYAHCSSIDVEKGRKVQKGDTIGAIGNLGVPVGSHLHFEIIKDGKYINPIYFLKVSAE